MTIAILVASIGAQSAFGADVARFEGEALQESSSEIGVSSDPNASGGQALRYTGQATANKAVNVSTRVTRLKVRVRGTVSANEWPSMRIFVDGTTIGTHDVATKSVASSSYVTYTFPVDVAAGQHTVYVRAMSGVSTDRRLDVDWVTFTYDADDADGNGVSDASDNCKDVANAYQNDADGDEIGDPCDNPPDDCDKFAAPTGSDANPGTLGAPHKTLQKLASSLSAGQTGCLRAGNYGGTDVETTIPATASGTSDANRTRIANYPGERVVYSGRVTLAEGANYVTFEADRLGNFELDGRGAPLSRTNSNAGRMNNVANVRIYGDHSEWKRLDITKHAPEMTGDFDTGKGFERTGICVLYGNTGVDYVPQGTLMEGNAIHGCGVTEKQYKEPDNHGVYMLLSRGTVLRNNLIYDNGERGVQVYSNSNGSIIEGNVVFRNYQNVDFDGTSRNNMVRNNVLAFPRNLDYNVYQGPSATGTNNRVENNCAYQWDGKSGLRVGSTIFYSGNITAAPLLEHPGTLAMKVGASSDCRSVYSGP